MSSYVPKIEGPANPSEDSFQINPFTYRPQGYIQDDWALRLDPATTPDNELRAGAYAIMSQAFGIRDNDGRTFSGVDHKALTGAEYYAKAKESWEKGRLPYTDDWDAYWEAESAGDRAAMRKIAKENYRGEGAGDDAAALIDRNDNFGAANTYGSDDERDERIRGELESIKDAIAPEDWAQVEAYFGREGEEDSPSARKSRAANRLQELNARLHEIERETISIPAYQETGYEDEIAKIGEEQQALEAELEGMDAEVVESRGAVDAVRRKYYDTIRDEQRLAKYEKQLLDDNLFAQVESVKRVVSDDARKVIEMAQDAGENPTAKPVLDAFEKLPTEDQRAIAGVLQSLHYGRDTTLLGDCFRSFWDTTRQTFGGAIRGAADTVRRSFMDAQDYRDYVERRSLLESVNQERAKEWGYLGKSVIGAFSTIPYMAAAAIPYAGTPIVMASAADQFQSEAALNGVDVGSRDFALARWAFAGAYAAVEKAQLLPFKPIGAFSRRQAYCEMFSTLRGAILVPGAIVGNAVSETLEEGVQGGIERVVESWGLDSNAAQDFARGFAQDFVDSFGTMVLVGGGAVGTQAYRYRHGAVGLDRTEQLGALAQARDTANSMEGHLDSPPQPLVRFGKVWGRLAGDMLRAGPDVKSQVQAIERWGFTHEQASEMHGYLSTIWGAVSKDEKLRSAFVGGNKVMDAPHLLAKVLRTEVTTDKETGVQHVTANVLGRSVRFDFNPGDTLSHVVDPETQDEGMIFSIVERLNRNEKMVGGSGNLTVEGWKALTPEQRAERVKGWRVNGNIQLLAPDGTKVSRDALKKLTGNIGGRIITTDTALPQTVLHEAMHGVLAILQSEAAQDNAEAKALQDSLAKFFPAQNAQEAVNEEFLADTFQEWVGGKVDVVQATDTLSALRRFIERLLGDTDVALADLLDKRSEAGRLFALALTGDISPALEKEEGTKPEGPSSGEQGTKPAENPAPAEPASPSPAQQKLAELEAELAATPREEIAKRQRLENRIAEQRKKVEREGGGTRASISGIYTGTAADYDKPSLHYVGTGDGSQVYGWGLYGSNVRGVAATYAGKSKRSGYVMDFIVDGKRTSTAGADYGFGFELARRAIIDEGKSRDDALREFRENVAEYPQLQEAIDFLSKHSIDGTAEVGNIYEQTFFTNRAPGDESHLLLWYSDQRPRNFLKKIRDNLSPEQAESFKKAYDKAYRSGPGGRAQAVFNGDVYGILADILGSQKAASEFLRDKCDIDGVKYPVDSFRGPIRDGNVAGWNYVSFRDDNIRVDHKWVDGDQRYSIAPNPNLKEEVESALNTDKSNGLVDKRRTVVRISGVPRSLVAFGIPDAPIETRVDVVRKLNREHYMSAEQIADIPNRLPEPVALFKEGEDYIVLTDMLANTRSGLQKPVMVLLRPWTNQNGERVFLASAYAREPQNENKYEDLANTAGAFLYIDKKRIATLGLEERTISTLNTPKGGEPATILPQSATDVKRFSLSSPVERTPDLVAFHNASASGLKGMDELGGLAMPSFAVTKDSIGGNEFGEITLLVRPDVIDPTDRTNRIFSNDAWTPSFPSVRLRAVPKMVERAQDRFRDIFTKKADGPWKGFADGWSSVTGDAEYFDDLLNRFDDIEAALRGRDVFKAAFLVDTGRAFPLPTREEEVFRSGFGAGFLVYADNKAIAAISQSPLGDRLVPNGEAVNYQEAEELVKDEDFLKSLQQTVLENSASFEAIGERFRGLELAKWAKTKPELSGYKLRDLADAVDYWRRNGGAGQTLDRGAAKKAVDEAIEKNRAAYDAWIKEFAAGLTDGKRYIRNDKDVYTPSGNRRPFEKLYDPLTLAAAVRAMLKQQNDQGNGFLGRNPFGVAAKEFKSLEAVIKDEDRLKKLPAEEVKKLKEALTARLSELVIEYEKTQASPDENPFTAHSRAADMMMDAYAAAKGNKARLSRELNGWGYRASEEFVDAFLDVMNDMASMPEDYFEAKAYRAVHFDEIAEALVPDNADAETIDILRRRGVPFRTYKAGDNSDRLRALNEAATDRDARFSISGPVGAESLGIRNLPDAEAMERSGASRLDIWRETGWWRGKDGQWRVEIPDFELNADAPRMLLASGTAHLADLIPPGSAILRAYPSLGKMRINVVESQSLAGRNNGISIDIDRGELSSPDRLRTTLAHEIQHSLQSIEGFARGGTPDTHIMRGDDGGDQAVRLRSLTRQRNDLKKMLDSFENGANETWYPPSLFRRLGVEWSHSSIAGRLDEVNAEIKALRKTGARSTLGKTGYNNLAGEAEARLVEKRLVMTPEERAARPPWEDFDVAEADQLVRGVEQTLPKAVVESPHYDGIDEDTDAPRFSIATYENGGRRMLSAYLDVAVSKGDLLRRDADDILRETDFVAGIAKRFAKDKRFRDFGAWSKAVVETDDEGRPMFGVVRSNGDYAMNIDFSTVCKKRRPMDRIFARLVRDGVLTGANVDELSGEAVAGIQRIIKAHGLEVACALCFVDAKRYRLGEVAKRFADGGRTSEGKSFAGWNNLVAMQAEGGRKWADRVKKAKGKTDFESRCVRAIESDPSVRVRVEGAQLVSSEGMDALAKNAPGIYELWRSYGGTSHAKDSHWDAPYNNDVIRPFKSRTNPDGYQFDPKKAFAIGGVRLQSFSDFVGRMFFDYVQMFAELAAKKLPLHVYTKEPNFVKLFHLTNAKINMSLVPAVVDGGVAPGLDADGNYAWADECFPPDEAFALRKLGGNVGTIAVGVSDEHIRKLLRDPTIDMVIPYHKSGINPVVASIRKIDQFKDYSKVQNTMNAKRKAYKGKEHFDFYGVLAKTKNPKKTAREYVAWCKERNLLPKFDAFANEENYYKLLEDFRLYDENGKYAPQEAVRQKYPENVGQLVEESLELNQSEESAYLENEDEIVREIEDSILRPQQGLDARLKSAMDEAAAAAGQAARASISWNGPAYSYRSFATAYAARDRILGIQRPDDDYAQLLAALGIEDYPIEDLRREAEKIGAEGVRQDADDLAKLAGLAENRSFRRTVERLLSGSLHLGTEVGASARAAHEAYLAHMRRTAKGRDYDDFCRDLGMDPAALALSIAESSFDPDAPAPKNPATGAEPAPAADGQPATSQPEMDGDLAALLDGKAAEFGLTEEQLRERVNARYEQRTQEIKDRLERLRARLDEWRVKEAQRKKRLAERQAAEGKTDEKPDLTDEEMFDAETNETEAGAKRLADFESECVEEMPDFQAFLEECRNEGLDLGNAAEFVAAVRLWVEDFIARETGSADPKKALRDPVALARYRATMMRFLHGMADAMLDPEDGLAAKTAERMMQEIPSDATVGEIDSRARVLVAFIQRNGIRQTRKQLVRELRKQIKLLAIRGKKFDEMEKDVGRKLTGEREAAARYLYRILTWSDGMVAKESQRLHDIVSGREAAYRASGADDEALRDLARTDREVHRATERLQMLRDYGSLRKKSPAEIKLAAKAIVEWLEKGREQHEKRWNDWHAALDELAARVAKAASASAKDYTPEDPGFVGKLADELTATVRQRLERIFAGSGADGQKAIDEVMRLVYLGSERMQTEKVRARQRTDRLLEQCVQGTGRTVNDFLKSLDELIPEDLNRALKTDEQPVRMTNGQALQLLASLEQTASYEGNVEANFRGATDRDGNPQIPHADLLRRYFEDKPEMVRLLEGVREVYDERREELSDAFLAVTGNPILAPDPLYAPVRMFRGSSEGFETRVKAWDPFGPALTPRVKNTLDFDLRASILDLYEARTRETCRVLAWGLPGMELRSVLCRKEVQDAIARTHGKFALRQLVAHLTDVVSDGWEDEPSGYKALAQKLGSATTYSALSWNVVTMLKQMTSIPAWTALMDGGYSEVFKNIVSFDREAAKEMMAEPGFVARYGADSFAKMFKDALDDPRGGNLLQRFFAAGMTAVQFGDFVPGILVGTGVYKARKEALMRSGMEERQAREEAARIAWGLVEECQQSSRIENSPAFLRRGGFMARQAAKFASSPLLQVSHEWHTLRMWAAEASAEAVKAGRGGNLASQMWFAKSEDAKRWRRRFLNQVICNHVLMPGAMYAVATAFDLALGSEPPEEEEVLGDVVMQMLSGPFSRIFLIGMVFDKGGEAVARMMGGKPNVYDSTGLASQQYLQKVFGQIGRIGGDVADADWESVRDDFLKMLGQVSAPARYAVKAGQNIAGYDPAEARRERKAELRKAQ